MTQSPGQSNISKSQSVVVVLYLRGQFHVNIVVDISQILDLQANPKADNQDVAFNARYVFCTLQQNLRGCGFWLIESRSKEGGVCCKLALGTPVVHKRLARMDLTSNGTSKWQDDSFNFAWTTNILHLSRGSFPRKAVNH